MSVTTTPASVLGCPNSREHSRVGWVRGWVRNASWYLRELSGESGYEHYLAAHMAGKHAAHHPPMTRREFERWRVDRGDTSPGARCC